MPLAQSRISLGFRTDVTLRSAQYPAMLLLNAMLGGGEQNRLYTVVRGRMALCYEAGSWYDGHKGILAASAGCGRTDLPAVEQEILHQLAELAAGRFSQSELETARTGLLSDLRLLCDSPGRLDEFYTGRAAEGISQSPAELAAALCAVTAEDVCAAARAARCGLYAGGSMSWKDYPALSERCYLETLPNGLRLRVVPKPGFAGKFAFLGVNFGSCDTQLPQNGGWQTVPDGTAHFLEHRMFCLPDCDPETEFSRLGAEANAFTDYAMTGYYFTCTDRFDDCLRLLLRMASTPYFPQEAMAAERAVIADEIALYDDSPEDCVQERLCRALYRRHPIRIPIAGSRRSIRAVTPELLRRCF